VKTQTSCPEKSLLLESGADSFALKEVSMAGGKVLERSQISTSFFILS
jgi:hypothetical protein